MVVMPGFGARCAMHERMKKKSEITNLEQLLDRMEEASQDRDRVTLGTIAEAIGRRSFGPVLLVPALMAIVPGLGDIPGVTTAMAVVVALTAGQLLFGRKHLWLPGWLTRRSVSNQRLRKAIGWMRRPAGIVDAFLRPRLAVFTHDRAIAAGCIVVAVVMPLMEVVPFGAIAAGVALAAFGLALVAHDGLLALLAFAATGLTVGVGVYSLL